jgi:hypothetical protein
MRETPGAGTWRLFELRQCRLVAKNCAGVVYVDKEKK